MVAKAWVIAVQTDQVWHSYYCKPLGEGLQGAELEGVCEVG
jgi:hypothetical protein